MKTNNTDKRGAQSRILSTMVAMALSFAATLDLQAATLTPTGDTYITQHSGLGGSTSNHDSDTKEEAIGTSTFLSYPLFQFDLTSFSGATVTGSSTLSLYVTSGFGLDSPRTVSLYEVLITWNPATVTYDTFGGSSGVQFGTDVGSAALDTETIGFTGMTPQYVSWTIPIATIQNWIDNPSQNHGFLIRNQTGANHDLQFDSLEGTNKPQLTIPVPEPSTWPMLAAGAASLLVFRRRRA